MKRSIGIALALVLSSAGLFAGTVGCGGEAQIKVGNTTPPPPPAPADKDGDGFVDAEDKCVDQAEDGLPPEPKDGCPTTDPDKDNIVGEADKCPTEPETVNDYEDQDGCPDQKPMVVVKATEIQINQKIQFKKGSAEIDQSSTTLIENIANVMKEHKEIDYVEVAGHASKEGDDAYNKDLTTRRAKAVMEALAKLGVDKSRMRSGGYGVYCPVDTGEGEVALEKNRRVEFKILRKDGKETNVKWGGCEGAEKKGMKILPLPKTETKKAEPAKAEPKKAEPAKAEPKKAEPAKAEPKKAEPAKAEPKKAEPAKDEPKKAEPAKDEPKKDAPVKAEPTKK